MTMPSDTYDCAGAMLVRCGSILLGRRAVDAHSFPNRWDVLGGRRRTGESFAAALVREVEEEAGVVPVAFREWGCFSLPDGGTLTLYLVTEWHGGLPRIRGGEHSELRWFTFADASALPDLVAPELALVIEALGSASQ
jgi:8-oxo-dGTP pyrophosphatase MutT (NUDIX family)